MTPLIEIYPYKALCMLLQQEVPNCKTIGIFLTANAQGREEWRFLDDVLILDVQDILDPKNPNTFQRAHAREVLRFLQKNKDSGRICVCCDSGQSRSAATAAAIIRHFGGDDIHIWKNPRYKPNTLVYQRLLDAFGIEAPPEDIHFLRELNEKAFHNAIKSNY